VGQSVISAQIFYNLVGLAVLEGFHALAVRAGEWIYNLRHQGCIPLFFWSILVGFLIEFGGQNEVIRQNFEGQPFRNRCTAK
jgi:hypothetical protein